MRLDQARDHYWANVPALGDDTVRVAQKVLAKDGDVLLTSGAWGTMEIEYDGTYELKGRKYPFYIREFTPLQYTRLNLDDFVEKRSSFSDDEWLDLLVQSIGFNPARFERRMKMLMLMRLVPFVESNFNLIELGPRETGKTYTFRNTSSRAFVVSGGKPRHRLPPSKDHSLNFAFCRCDSRQVSAAREARAKVCMHARSVPAAALCGPVAFQYGPVVR